MRAPADPSRVSFWIDRKVGHDLVSVCITTRHRRELLLGCIASVLRQAHRPLQIVVGDNSEDDDTERAVRALALPTGVELDYHRHEPVVSLSENTNSVFRRARGDRLMLMHDDDLVCDGGLDALVAAWDASRDPAAVYGRSYQIRADGEIDHAESDRVNRIQKRTDADLGEQRSKLLAGVVQQFPVNGYLVDAALARSVGWRPHGQVGLWADVDFGIRVALAAGDRRFVLIPEHVSSLRMSDTRLSSSRSSDFGALQFLEQIRTLEAPPDCRPSLDELLQRVTGMAVVEAAVKGRRREAFRLLRSRSYPHGWIHPATLYRVAYIVHPPSVRLANRWLRGLDR